MTAEYLTVSHLSTKDLKRFFSKVQVSTTKFYKNSPCWEWQAYRCEGYGRFGWKRPDGKMTMMITHRLMYAWLVAPLPYNTISEQVDHLCRNRSCCNPIHLEFVAKEINWERSESPTRLNSLKTHCNNGHLLAGENLEQVSRGRRCRTCHKADSLQRHYAKSKPRQPVTHCPRGHDKRIVGMEKSSRCKQCNRDDTKAWRLAKKLSQSQKQEPD